MTDALFATPAMTNRPVSPASQLLSLSVLRLSARGELWYLPASDEWMVMADPVSPSVQPLVDDLRDGGLIDADGAITDAGRTRLNGTEATS